MGNGRRENDTRSSPPQKIEVFGRRKSQHIQIAIDHRRFLPNEDREVSSEKP